MSAESSLRASPSRGRPPLGWSKACLAVDVRCAEPVILLAERTRGRLAFRPADLSQVSAAGAPPVCACLSAGESLVQWVTAPFSSMSKARRVLPTLLDIAMPFPVEDCAVEFLDVHRDEGGRVRALAVTARNAQVAARLEGCRESGFDPVCLDPEALVMWTQSLLELPAGRGLEQEPRAVLSAERDRFCLVIGRGARPLGAHLLRSLSAPELVRLLSARLGSAASPVRWRLCGSLAADPSVRRAVCEELPGEWRAGVDVHADPRAFVARGLATRALLPGPLRVNLRGGTYAHTVTESRTRKSARTAAALLVAAGLLVCAADIFAMARMRAARAAVDAEFSSLRDRLLGYRLAVKGERAVSVVAAEVESRKQKTKPLFTAFAPSLVTRAGRIMDTAKRDSLQLDSLTITPLSVAISGTAAGWNGWSGLAAALAADGYRTELKPGAAGPDGRVPFAVATGGAIE